MGIAQQLDEYSPDEDEALNNDFSPEEEEPEEEEPEDVASDLEKYNKVSTEPKKQSKLLSIFGLSNGGYDENKRYYILEKNTLIREIRGEKEYKKINGQWHYEGWDSGGVPILLHNTQFQKIKPLVEYLLTRKSKFPIWAVILMGAIGFIIFIFLCLFAAKLYVSIVSSQDTIPNASVSPATLEKAGFVQTSTGASTPASTAIPAKQENSGNTLSGEIDFARIKADMEIQKINEEKDTTLATARLTKLQNQFDNLKEEYDSEVEKNNQLQADSDKYYILKTTLSRWCATTETNESAELCTKIFTNQK